MPLRLVRTLIFPALLALLGQNSGIGQTVLNWDFEESSPAVAESFAYAFQGAPNCVTELDDDEQVTVTSDVLSELASATFDTTRWDVSPNACWSGAGWGLRFEHNLEGVQSLTSADLAEYNVSFDASMEGAEQLRTRLQVQFQDNRELDENGAPVTRVWLENNLQTGDGDLEPFVLTAEPQNISVNLAELGFRDEYSIDDFASFFDSVTSLSITLQSEGLSGLLPAESSQVIGFDADNSLYLDNIVLEGPVGEFVPKCNPETAGDLDGSGSVDFADFLVLSGNFGQPAEDHTSGDIDCSGDVGFADFLVLSGNFGKTFDVEVTSVPEPKGTSYVCLMVITLLMLRRRCVRDQA